jgi:hypothetical protein
VSPWFLKNLFLTGSGKCVTRNDVFVEASSVETTDETLDLASVICLQPDLAYFCSLINAAKSDAVVASLFDPNTVATVFAPTTRVGSVGTSCQDNNNVAYVMQNIYAHHLLSLSAVRTTWYDVLYNRLVAHSLIILLT